MKTFSYNHSNNIKYLAFIILFIANITASIAQNTEVIYLSGKGSNDAKQWDFYCTKGLNSGKWTKIEVPSCWEQQGFGTYNYGYDKSDGRADEKGIYKYKFTVPQNWKNKIINIVFDGSMTDTEVKINGKIAGSIHQGSFYRFKYDISKLINFNTSNLLEVTVSKVSTNTSVNKAERNADYWIFGGIFRPVHLEAFPQNHIAKVQIDAKASGVFKAKIHLPKNSKKGNISVQIKDTKGNNIGNSFTIDTDNKQETAEIITKISNPKLWSNEFPNLYLATFTLTQNGEVKHQITERFGFRTIELRPKDGIYLNGTKIKFKGVNRHCFRPETGRTINRQQSINDVKLIKQMNMNAVRNSHYPADEHFYDACDSLGIMVLDELGGWHDAYDTKVGSQLVKEMIEVSENHPCVIMWVNGNEGGHNRELLPLYKSFDLQQRHVLHAWEVFDGTDTQHYRDFNYGVGSHYQGHEVVFPTEFLHGVYDGGHGAGLDDFWTSMWHNPLSAGGFLWNFADEAIIRKDKNDSIDSDGNHGADGILGPHHEKEGSFYTIKEVWSPIYFEHREITPDFDGNLRIENRFYFTNLNQCKFEYTLQKMQDPNDGLLIKPLSGTINPPNVLPYNKDTLKLNLPKKWLLYDILYITAYDPFNNEIYSWSWPISLPAKVADRIVDKNGNSKPIARENDNSIIVIANGVTVSFSKKSGLLENVSNTSGSISFNNGPILCEGFTNFAAISYHTDGNNIIVNSTFEKQTSFHEVKWTIYPSGWIKLDVEYCPEVEQSVLMGINFSYPEKLITGMKWLGKGPYRVWKNRIKGTTLNVWHKKYNNTITGEAPYEYPEFKGYYANLYWLTVETTEQPFTIVCPDEDMFFRMLTPDWPKQPFNTAPPFPDGDISFLHGITPIGTKPLSPERMGPSGQKNIYYSYEKQRCKNIQLYFDFRVKMN
ncbi:MAG: hypothetical protein JW717_02725 [Marinilabiliaceae bacterium]|nr:hypothetical protein [Marinilabiliaceae bacterium]